LGASSTSRKPIGAKVLAPKLESNKQDTSCTSYEEPNDELYKKHYNITSICSIVTLGPTY